MEDVTTTNVALLLEEDPGLSGRLRGEGIIS